MCLWVRGGTAWVHAVSVAELMGAAWVLARRCRFAWSHHGVQVEGARCHMGVAGPCLSSGGRQGPAGSDGAGCLAAPPLFCGVWLAWPPCA